MKKITKKNEQKNLCSFLNTRNRKNEKQNQKINKWKPKTITIVLSISNHVFPPDVATRSSIFFKATDTDTVKCSTEKNQNILYLNRRYINRAHVSWKRKYQKIKKTKKKWKQNENQIHINKYIQT